jgi:hypothetical protein
MKYSQEYVDDLIKRSDRALLKFGAWSEFNKRSEGIVRFHVTARRAFDSIAHGYWGGQGTLDLDETPSRAVALQETESGYSTLNAHVLFQMCAALEALCIDFVRVCIEQDPRLQAKGCLAKVKFSVPDFISMSEADRAAALTVKLLEDLGAPHKLGVDKFHDAFDFVGFGFPVEDDWRRQLREMYAVRNVLLHRGGVADKRFTDTCPWLEAKQGDPVTVSSEQLTAFMQATAEYVLAFRAVLLTAIKSDVNEYVEYQDWRKEQDRQIEEERKRTYVEE